MVPVMPVLVMAKAPVMLVLVLAAVMPGPSPAVPTVPVMAILVMGKEWVVVVLVVRNHVARQQARQFRDCLRKVARMVVEIVRDRLEVMDERRPGMRSEHRLDLGFELSQLPLVAQQRLQ